MSRQNRKIIIIPRRHDHKGDLSKQWCVFYSVRNPKSGLMQRFRVYEGFAEKFTEKAKREAATSLIETLKNKLLSGWTPYNDEEVIYEDNLVYKKVSQEYGNVRKSNKRFAYYASLWLGQMTGIRPSTRTSYKSKLRYFIEFLKSKDIQDNDVCEFSRDRARQFGVYLKNDRKLAGKTINEYNLLLKAFFKYLKGESLVSENPYEGIKRVKSESVKPLIFNSEQLSTLVKHSRKNDPQMMVVIKIIFNCFIRPGELRKLRMRDVDFGRGIIRIPANVAKTKVDRVVDVPSY